MFKIALDSREQAPFEFTDARYENVPVIVQALKTADYSVVGYENLIGVERKSLADMMCSISNQRERFERELERAMEFHAFMIVVESPFRDIATNAYRSNMSVNAAVQTVFSWMSKYRLSWWFAESRSGAEFATYHFLRHFYKRQTGSKK